MAVNVPEWLNGDFCQGLLNNLDGSQLTSWKAVAFAIAGDNYSSVLHGVSLKSNTTSISVVVKSLPLGTVMRDYMLNDGIFTKEADLYANIFPAMYKLYTDHGGTLNYFCPLSHNSPLPNTIVLQDLRPLGYTLANRQSQMDIGHSICAIRTLALFHALSVGLHSRNPALIECYKENNYVIGKRQVMKDYTTMMLLDLASEVETWPECERFGERLRRYSETMVDSCIDVFENMDGYFLVLNHGDFWSSNMLFRYTEGGEPEDVKFVDFQYSKYAPAVIDILYFLYTSVQEDVRENHRDKILEEYLSAMRDTFSIIGCLEPVPSLERLKEEMEGKLSIVGMITCTILPPIVANQEEMANFGTVDDGIVKEGVVQNPMHKSIKGCRFREIFPPILIELERNGIL